MLLFIQDNRSKNTTLLEIYLSMLTSEAPVTAALSGRTKIIVYFERLFGIMDINLRNMELKVVMSVH